MKIPRVFFATLRNYKPSVIFHYTNYGGTGLHHYLIWRWMISVDFESPLWDLKKARGRG